MEYSINLCRKCGSVCAARSGASTFGCTTCGTRNSVAKAVRLVDSVPSKDVPSTIASYKMAMAKCGKKQ